MGSKGVVFTYRDYLFLDDDKRHEVLEGDLVMVPAPSWEHQEVAKRLFRVLDAFVETHSLGVVQFAPVDVVLSEENVVQPDLLFVARDRLGVIKERGVFGAPDLAVEILSPTKKERDEIAKKRLYGRFGVREYWIADIEEKTIEVLTLKESGLETHRVHTKGSSVQSPFFPGLSFETDNIFR